VIIEHYGQSGIVLGLIQLCVFGSFTVGAQTTKHFITDHNLKKILYIGLSLAAVGALSGLLISYVMDDIFYLPIACMMLVGYGASMVFSPMYRLGVEAATEPMGRRISLQGALTSMVGALCSVLAAGIENSSFFNMYLCIGSCCSVALLVFFSLRGIPIAFRDKTA
ncbi:MAG: hypothetical protein V4490_03160, partial [Pseudomonadota bacterium]